MMKCVVQIQIQNLKRKAWMLWAQVKHQQMSLRQQLLLLLPRMAFRTPQQSASTQPCLTQMSQ